MTLDFIIYQKYRLVTNGQAVGLLRIKDNIIQVETYEKNTKRIGLKVVKTPFLRTVNL